MPSRMLCSGGEQVNRERCLCALSLAMARIESYLCRGLSMNCSALQSCIVSEVCLIFDYTSRPRPAKMVCLFAHRYACAACHTGTGGTPFLAKGPPGVSAGLSVFSGERIPPGFLRCLVELRKRAENQHRPTIRGSWRRAGSCAPGRRPRSRAEHRSEPPGRISATAQDGTNAARGRGTR